LNVNSWPTILVCSPLDSVNITGLAATTQYAFRIRTNCGPCNELLVANLSDWSPITTFTTPAVRELEEMPIAQNEVSVYPNPNRGNFVIDIESIENQNVSIRMVDVTGREVINQTTVAEKGHNSLPIELNDYASGVYMLQLTISGEVKVIKVVVE